MEHSAAILEDAGKTVDNAAGNASKDDSKPSESSSEHRENKSSDNRREDRKRKGNWNDSSVRHGKKGKFDDNRRNKKGDMGRTDYLCVSQVWQRAVQVELTSDKCIQPRQATEKRRCPEEATARRYQRPRH